MPLFVRTLSVVLSAALLLIACGGPAEQGTASSGATVARAVPRQLAAVDAGYGALAQRLYVAYFGRPADPQGESNLAAALAGLGVAADVRALEASYATDARVRTLVDAFGKSAESTALYGSGDATAFVTAIYANVLGRAPDAEGLAFWTAAIERGGLGRARAALAIMAGAAANTSTQGREDAALLGNRVGLASLFTQTLRLQDKAALYVGDRPAAIARELLSTVDAHADTAGFAGKADTMLGLLAVAGDGATGAPAVVPINAAPRLVAGVPATLNVVATGAAPLRYQWYRHGVQVAGATGPSLSLPAPHAGDDGAVYTVEVTNGLGTATSKPVQVEIALATPVQALTGCREITTPGSYRMPADIAPDVAGLACLHVHDTHDVLIDCGNHDIRDDIISSTRGLYMARVERVALRNCRIFGSNTAIEQARDVVIRNSRLLTLQPKDPLVVLQLQQVENLAFVANDFHGSVQDWHGIGNMYVDSTLTSITPSTWQAPIVHITYGRDIVVARNRMDAGWISPAVFNQAGGPAVDVADSTGTVIDGNVVRNIYSAGIRLDGTIRGLSVRNNDFDYVWGGAVAGGTWLSVIDADIIRNRLRHGTELVWLYRVYGLRPAFTDSVSTRPADTAVEFRNILLDGNVFSDPLDVLLSEASHIAVFSRMDYYGHVSAPDERVPLFSEFKLGPVVVRNNDFGRFTSPPGFAQADTIPVIPGVVIDGGGNICRTSTWPAYPLTCH